MWEAGGGGATVGRFLKFRVSKWHSFFCTLNAIIRVVGYVKWHIHVPISYQSPASASSAARICQPRVTARERSDRVGEGLGNPPPTVGRFFFIFVYENGIFLHILCHY